MTFHDFCSVGCGFRAVGQTLKDMKHDSWTATDTIMGENQLVVKTTGRGCEESIHFSCVICWSGDGLLTLRLKETGGFKWEHIGSYRLDAQ